MFGIVGHLAWRFSPRSLGEMMVKASSFVKTVIWIGMEIIVIPISILMTTIAYGGLVFLSWLFGTKPA